MTAAPDPGEEWVQAEERYLASDRFMVDALDWFYGAGDDRPFYLEDAICDAYRLSSEYGTRIEDTLAGELEL